MFGRDVDGLMSLFMVVIRKGGVFLLCAAIIANIHLLARKVSPVSKNTRPLSLNGQSQTPPSFERVNNTFLFFTLTHHSLVLRSPSYFF